MVATSALAVTPQSHRRSCTMTDGGLSGVRVDLMRIDTARPSV
jgi:hypothetical protein